MFINYPTIDLSDALVLLHAGGRAEPAAPPGVGDTAPWTVALIPADDGRSLHRRVWERHPAGDELLCVLSGAVEVYLRDHDLADEPVATLTPGRALVVPVGRWHRLDVRQPGQLLAVTRRSGTEHEAVRPVTTRSRAAAKGERSEP